MKNLLFLLLIFSACTKLTIEDRKDQCLQWLTSLEKNNEKRVLTGQFIGWGTDTYFSDIDSIQKISGKWLGHLGLDYHTIKQDKTNALLIDITTTNKIIIDYGVKFCNFSMHLNNPFTNSSSWDTTGNLSQLWVPGNPFIVKLQAELDTMAKGILDLQQHNIVVLLRPLHENNGNWFWWCKDTANFKKLWIYIYNDFMLNKKLKNIIWAYSPSSIADPLPHYPGDKYVDVVCLDAYTPNLVPDIKFCYDQLATLNKPIGLGEYGCMDGGDIENRNNYRHDFIRFVDELKTSYPKICFFLTWRKSFSLIHHQNIDKMLQDPLMINKNDLPEFLRK